MTAKVSLISYQGYEHGEVPAFLVLPDQPETKNGIVFLHSAVTNKTLFLDEAKDLASLGFASLLIDAPYARPGLENIRKGKKTPASEHQYTRHVLSDVRLGFDFLQEIVGVERFLYVGKNLGATLLGQLSAVEERLHAAVFVAGIPRLSYFWEGSSHPVARSFRDTMNAGDLRTFVEGTRDLDFVASSSCQFTKNWLFQFGKQDDWIPKSEVEFIKNRFQGSHTIRWYEDDHDMNTRAVARERAEWLVQAKI
ncbi:MAG: dienelactone hydrolase family protein [Oligoflexales bacterium]